MRDAILLWELYKKDLYKKNKIMQYCRFREGAWLLKWKMLLVIFKKLEIDWKREGLSKGLYLSQNVRMRIWEEMKEEIGLRSCLSPSLSIYSNNIFMKRGVYV